MKTKGTVAHIQFELFALDWSKRKIINAKVLFSVVTHIASYSILQWQPSSIDGAEQENKKKSTNNPAREIFHVISVQRIQPPCNYFFLRSFFLSKQLPLFQVKQTPEMLAWETGERT